MEENGVQAGMEQNRLEQKKLGPSPDAFLDAGPKIIESVGWNSLEGHQVCAFSPFADRSVSVSLLLLS